MISVWKGCCAQSNSIQPQIPRLGARVSSTITPSGYSDGTCRLIASTQIGHQAGSDRQARDRQLAALGQRLQPVAHAGDTLAAGFQPGRDRIVLLAEAGECRR